MPKATHLAREWLTTERNGASVGTRNHDAAVCALASLDELERLRASIESIGADARARFWSWRGVDEPCPGCGGAGTMSYGNTTTWRGGFGGQAMTQDVCNRCWGTGDAHRHGVDLRKLWGELENLKRGRAVALAAIAEYQPPMEELRDAADDCVARVKKALES